VLDARARPMLAGSLNRVAAVADRAGLSPLAVTAAGLVLGLGSAGAAALRWWPAALALWLLSRLVSRL